MIRYFCLFFLPLFFLTACDSSTKDTKSSLSEKKDSEKIIEEKEKPNDASYMSNILKKAPHSHSEKKVEIDKNPPPMDSDISPPPGSKKALEIKTPQ